MRVTLRYFGHLRHLAGVESESAGTDTGELRDALSAAAARHGQAFADVVFDKAGTIRPGVLVLVNDEPTFGKPKPLRDGDAVSLIPAIAGG